MNKLKIVALVILFAGVVYMMNYLRHNTIPLDAVAPIVESPQSRKMTTASKASDFAQKSISIPSSQLAKISKPDCRKQAKELFEATVADLVVQKYRPTNDCRLSNVAIPQVSFADCEKGNKIQCTAYLMLFRALELAKLVDPSEINSSMSVEMLSNVSIARFLDLVSGEMTQDKLVKLKQVSTIWRDADPRSMSPVKFLLFSEALPYVQKQGGSRQLIDQYIKDARSLDPHDGDVEQFEIVVNAMEKGKAYLDDYLAHNPQSSYANYMRSNIAFKDGDIATAKEFLANALEIDPKNESYKETLEKINKGETGKIYTIQMKLFDPSSL